MLESPVPVYFECKCSSWAKVMFFSMQSVSNHPLSNKMNSIKSTISRLIAPISSNQRLCLRKYSLSANFSHLRKFSSAVDSLNKEQVQERVFNVLKAFDKVATSVPSFQSSASFTSDLGLDSLDVVEVVMAVEEEFGIEIPDDAADEFKTPQEVIDYVHSKLHKH